MRLARRALLAAAPLLLMPGCGRAQAASLLKGELHHGLIFVQASVRDAQGWFLLDTGAPVTLLDQAFAGRGRVDLGRPEVLRGAGGARKAWRGEATPLRLLEGPETIIEPSVTDLSGIGAGMGVPLAGVIGGDVLARHVLMLDYRTAAVRLATGGSIPAPANAVRMRVGRTPYVQAAAVYGAKRSTAEFQIDTGANTAVVLWRPFAERAFPGAGAAAGAALGVGGVTRTRIGRLSALEVGGVSLKDLEANFADDTRPDDAGPNHGGVIGGPAWTSLTITVDYPGERFWFG